jgi:hypothetical protein
VIGEKFIPETLSSEETYQRALSSLNKIKKG